MTARALPHDEQPDPRFAAQLEWELERALRREARFARPAREAGARRPSPALLALGFVAALALGGGGAWAAQNVLRSRGAQALVAQQSVRVELAARHERRARSELERAQVEHAAGRAPATKVLASRAELALASEQLELGRIDRFEVEATSRPAQHALSAALVTTPAGARDLVRERLEVEGVSLTEQLAVARELAERANVQASAGVATQADARRWQLGVDRLTLRAELARRRRELRADFVAARTSAARCELLDLQAQAQTRRDLAQLELQGAREAHERLQLLVQNGLVSAREFEQAELALATHAAELESANSELEWLAEELVRAR
ncbi:MAG: hypothetical protein JNN27_11150 [Planctomycetes bacterium]|nr:hypothetical protein [Planctomycetota bacterium]